MLLRLVRLDWSLSVGLSAGLGGGGALIGFGSYYSSTG